MVTWRPDERRRLRQARREAFPDLVGLMALLCVLVVGAVVFAR